MKKFQAAFAAVLMVSVLFFGCSNASDSDEVAAKSSAKSITAFAIGTAAGVIDETAKTIAVTVPNGTAVTTLVATFVPSAASTVKVGTVIQASGTTPNDFTNPVAYTVTAEDGTFVTYTVTVTVAPAAGPSSAKAISAFSIDTVAGVIDETAKTIAVTVPNGTAVTALVATFTASDGSTVSVASAAQTSGTTANDFTNPVTYTVTAADASTAAYTVTVTVAAAAPSYSTTVFEANFQTLPTGLTDGSETTLSTAISLPTVTNTNNYTAALIGKLKVSTAQTAATLLGGGASGFSAGCVQFGNNTTSIGKVTISGVTGPFMIVANHAPSSTGDAARKLRVDINGTQVYSDGNGYGQTCSYTYTGTDSASIELYGFNGTAGAGVRIYDVKILK
jgi:hypothetical protein